MCKTITLFNKVVSVYNKTFSTPAIVETITVSPKVINIEHLIELTMAKVGGYNFIDADHCDFDDGSECKTGSISPNPKKKGRNSYRLEISNIVSPGGTIKTGAVRTVIYNPHTHDVHYYFIPSDKLESLGINRHPTTGIGRVFATWNSVTNKIPKLDPYKVTDFETLCKLENC